MLWKSTMPNERPDEGLRMSQRLRAVYRSGNFLPQEPCDVLEGSEVELTIKQVWTIGSGVLEQVPGSG
jgi:predicted DNA-binding antitoxin AbrB/MazE fold protein